MSRDADPLAGLVDAEGKLLDERSKLASLRGSHGILVPLDVQVVEEEGGAVPCLQYPVPASWPSVVTTADLWELIDAGLWGWERGERLSTTALLSRGRRGSSGTHGGANPTGLLNAFLRLARQRPPRDVVSAVKTFALQWGPLWVCRTPEHYNRWCFWEPRQALYWGGKATLCSWRPVEEVYAFVREARRVKAVLQVAGRLRQGNPVVDEKLWHAMGVHPTERSVLGQRQVLRHVVEAYLASHGKMQTWLLWVDLHASPTLQFVSKIGFLPAVWIEIAQILCHAKGVYACSDCGEWYVRIGRQPPKNRKNYCAECGAGNCGAAKLHNREKRGGRPVM